MNVQLKQTDKLIFSSDDNQYTQKAFRVILHETMFSILIYDVT